ncbi:MAG: hypothetical protein IT480_09735 [Gammaproteobacteria bacterium]|nr:hypothetical protein [Gammaproteobacteria bacterium]
MRSGEESNGNSNLERRARELLEASAAGLDGRVRSRLTRARHAALAVQRHARARRAWLSWAPVGALAAAVLGALVYVRHGRMLLPGHTPPASGADDLELLADVDALPLAEDAGDYDFYEWAASAAGETEAVGS